MWGLPPPLQTTLAAARVAVPWRAPARRTCSTARGHAPVRGEAIQCAPGGRGGKDENGVAERKGGGRPPRGRWGARIARRLGAEARAVPACVSVVLPCVCAPAARRLMAIPLGGRPHSIFHAARPPAAAALVAAHGPEASAPPLPQLTASSPPSALSHSASLSVARDAATRASPRRRDAGRVAVGVCGLHGAAGEEKRRAASRRPRRGLPMQ